MRWVEVSLYTLVGVRVLDKWCSGCRLTGLANMQWLLSFGLLSSTVSLSNYDLYFLPLLLFISPSFSPFPFGRRPHFIMAHAGLLLPTSSKLCAICHWGSVDEFLWLPVPLSPKNLIRSTQGPNRFLSCLDCIYRRSVAQRSPNRAFHNYSPFRFVYLYPPVQYLPSLLPMSGDEKFMDVGRESIRAFGEDLKIISIPLCLK